MSTGGARDRANGGWRKADEGPGPRYMAVQPPAFGARGSAFGPNGHRTANGRQRTPRPHADPRTPGPVRAGMAVTALCVVTAVMLLWAAIAGAAWIVWRLAGG